jgi:hypothetical protein
MKQSKVFFNFFLKKRFLAEHIQYIRSESNAALMAAGWMREGFVLMRKLSLYHSVLVAMLKI